MRFTSLLFLLTSISLYGTAQITDYKPLYNSTNFSKTIDVSLAVGFTKGIPSVSASGAAVYSVPVEIPPGTNGMVPTISLVYSSQQGNGLAGYGWSIAGLSNITVSNENFYFDNKNERYNVSSRAIVLDGQRLIPQLIGGVVDKYVTEVTDLSYVSPIPTSSNGIAHNKFLLTNKSGITTEYGGTPDAVEWSTSQAISKFPMAWLINKSTDESGNFIVYNYTVINGERLISKIEYTGNSNAGIVPYNSIVFKYSSRTDQNTFHSFGYTSKSANILDEIQVLNGTSIIRTYKLEYSLNFDGYSVLKSIKESGVNRLSYNSTIFRYGDFSDGNFLTTSNLPPLNNRFYPCDVNGDGLIDIAKERVGSTGMQE